MTFPQITITALVAAPPARVWSCWTEPEHITQWNFASDDWCCPRATNDLRVGGTYIARMEAKDGSFGFDFEAVWFDVTEGRSLGLKMGDGRSARTTFTLEGSGTRVTTVFDDEATHPLEMQRDGWQAILNNFKAYAERA